jgi:hypothetical protein
MRVDVASILLGMGYRSPEDFEAFQDTPGSADVVWLSKDKLQPTEKEIDFAADGVYADLKIKLAKEAVQASIVKHITNVIFENPSLSTQDTLTEAIARTKATKVQEEAKVL